jgi:hypothetical protein
MTVPAVLGKVLTGVCFMWDKDRANGNRHEGCKVGRGLCVNYVSHVN